MARKTIEIDKRIGNARVGLLITRGQIETLDGHGALKSRMLVDNGKNIIGFGSCQKHGIFDNPLTADQKRRAQTGVWGDAFKMVFLEDIGATDLNTDWADYVLDRIGSNQLPEPTDLYAGSTHEARWYEERFASLSGTPSYHRAGFDVWENPETGKRIHILDRKLRSGISSSEVRTLIERRDNRWKDHVSAKLWDFYEWEYPPHLRVALELNDGDDFPDAENFPIGTKCLYTSRPDKVYLLRADGKWRPRTPQDDAKSMGD